MTQWTEDQLAQAWHDLMGSYHSVASKLDAALKAEHDLTSSEFEVLQVLSVACGSGAVRMSQLADLVHLSQSALSRLVANLEDDGLVVRAMAPRDRRSVTATITEAGQRRHTEARPTQRSVLRAHASSCLPPGAELVTPPPPGDLTDGAGDAQDPGSICQS